MSKSAPPGSGLGGIRLDEAQRLAWLRLIRSESIGPRTFRALVNRYGSATAALQALPEVYARSGKSALRIFTVAEALAELEALHRIGGRLVALGEAEYPRNLAQIDAPPPLISVIGDISVLRRPMVAIVGSRNASAAGLRMTEKLALGLAAHGIVIVSGLARGIDARAHSVSAKTGTAAVFAGGLSHLYPPEHGKLLEAILEHGCALSEMPVGAGPRGRDFPRRNRIISGLSLGTIVVEAALKSGSLITARFANEQGREVFAVPGSPLDPRAEGANNLIRQGARLTSSAADVLDELAPLIAGAELPPAPWRDAMDASQQAELLWEELDLPDVAAAPSAVPEIESVAVLGKSAGPDLNGYALRARLAEAMGPSPIGIDELARLVGEDIRAVQGAILDLELDGRIERMGGQRVALIPV